MYEQLETINTRPDPFQYYTAEELWTDDYTSQRMLAYHLNEAIDVSSRNKKFIDRSVMWMADHFSINDSTEIADFGCGPGLYTTQLAEKGARVTGIDFSKRSINYAQKIAQEKKLDIDYVNKNYLDYETDKRFDIITMIMCDFCALGPEQRKLLLKKFHTFLKDDGSIILDVYTLNAFDKREEQSLYEVNLFDGFWSSEKYYGFLNTFKYDSEKVILDKYTIIEQKRFSTIYNWLQYYSKDSLAEEFAQNNFRIEKFYANVAGADFDSDSGEMAIIAKKN
jgi:SAM-dependent methyltransferase